MRAQENRIIAYTLVLSFIAGTQLESKLPHDISTVIAALLFSVSILLLIFFRRTPERMLMAKMLCLGALSTLSISMCWLVAASAWLLQ